MLTLGSVRFTAPAETTEGTKTRGQAAKRRKTLTHDDKCGTVESAGKGLPPSLRHRDRDVRNVATISAGVLSGSVRHNFDRVAGAIDTAAVPRNRSREKSDRGLRRLGKSISRSSCTIQLYYTSAVVVG